MQKASLVVLAAMLLGREKGMAQNTGSISVSAQANVFGSGIGIPPGGGITPPSISFPAGPGQVITFPSVTGGVSEGSVDLWGGDGIPLSFGPPTAGTNFYAQGGISALVDDPGTRFFLVGVFLTDATPLAPAPPALMNFSGAENFTDLYPGIGQTFFVGDGLTGTGSGQVQRFHVPATATRLFLGFADGNDFRGNPMFYQDNFGALMVQYTISSSTLAAPTNVQATQIGFTGDQIQLTWSYGSDPIDGFRIQSKTPSGNWVPLTTITSPQQRAYTDINVPPFFTVTYQIQAFQGNASSDYSDTATSFQISFSSVDCPTGSGALRAIGPCTNLVAWPGGQGTDNAIVAQFKPDLLSTLAQVAHDPMFGYDHFNWISSVMYLPPSVTEFAAAQNPTTPLTAPFTDPPIGGYTYQTFDLLPYYWDEQTTLGLNPDYFLLDNTIIRDNGTELQFDDHPHSSQLGQTDYIQFATTLVGIQGSIGNLSASTPLTSFTWSSNNRLGGIGGLADITSSGSDAGGIFNVRVVRIEDLPVNIRQLLIQAGAQGVSTVPKIDKDAPTTAAFLAGPQGANGWYVGPVQVTLIATDIDGPADIVGTAYSVDGSSAIGYAGPFTVATDGIHTIRFGSIDRAGNAETPLGSQIVNLDATPPRMACSANPSTLWPPNGKPVTVMISGTITDATSGVDPNSAMFAVTDEYGQVQPTGTVTLTGGSYSFGLSLIAERDGADTDGRTYKIVLTGKDKAGNIGSCPVVVTVPHDQGH